MVDEEVAIVELREEAAVFEVEGEAGQAEAEEVPKRAKRQRGRRPYCTTAAMDMAAAAGRLSIVQWLHSNRTEGCTKAAMDIAAANGHLEVVKWLHFNRSEGCTKTAIDLAAAKCLSEEPAKHASPEQLAQLAPFATPKDERRFEIIKFLHSKRSAGCTAAAMDAAASNGNLPLLKWLHSNMRARCTRQAMDDAAARGRLDIVKWIHQNRKGCTTAAMDWAAAGGHLEVVKWLHQNRREGCTTMAMDQAAANGELEMVQWLCANRSEGCTPDAIEAAARAGDLKIVKLLHSTNPDLLAVRENEDEILSATLEDYGVEFADESGEFARIANIEALSEAACGGYVDIVQWLVANCDDLDIVRAMEGPIVNGHFEVLLYLHSKHVGRPKAYDVKDVWDNLRVHRMSQQTPKPNLDKNIDWWFRENYPYPTDADVARDLMRDSVGLEHELSAHFEAAFARQFLR